MTRHSRIVDKLQEKNPCKGESSIIDHQVQCSSIEPNTPMGKPHG